MSTRSGFPVTIFAPMVFFKVHYSGLVPKDVSALELVSAIDWNQFHDELHFPSIHVEVVHTVSCKIKTCDVPRAPGTREGVQWRLTKQINHIRDPRSWCFLVFSLQNHAKLTQTPSLSTTSTSHSASGPQTHPCKL